MEDIRYYILLGQKIVPATESEWRTMWGNPDARRVAKTEIDDILISTVFLGIDHNFIIKGPPILFETMVFGGNLDEELVRYCTYEEAERGHKNMVQRVKNSLIEKEGEE